MGEVAYVCLYVSVKIIDNDLFLSGGWVLVALLLFLLSAVWVLCLSLRLFFVFVHGSVLFMTVLIFPLLFLSLDFTVILCLENSTVMIVVCVLCTSRHTKKKTGTFMERKCCLVFFYLKKEEKSLQFITA